MHARIPGPNLPVAVIRPLYDDAQQALFDHAFVPDVTIAQKGDVVGIVRHLVYDVEGHNLHAHFTTNFLIADGKSGVQERRYHSLDRHALIDAADASLRLELDYQAMDELGHTLAQRFFHDSFEEREIYTLYIASSGVLVGNASRMHDHRETMEGDTWHDAARHMTAVLPRKGTAHERVHQAANLHHLAALASCLFPLTSPDADGAYQVSPQALTTPTA